MNNRDKEKENLGQDRLSVLVVEDNEYMLDIFVTALKRMGFARTHRAKNAKEAVDYLRSTSKGFAGSEQVDIVISDLIMGAISGQHLLQWLRDDKASPNRFMPFIMISGAADRVNVETARDKGVTEFIVKPFSVESLYKVLQRIIDVPRQFVTTTTYFGPDRRRSSKAGPPGGNERRKPDESHATIVYSKDRVEKAAKPSDVWLFKLPNFLKQKMGSNAMRQDFTIPASVLAEAEAELKREAEGFIGWAKDYLNRLSTQVTEAKSRVGDRTSAFEEINLIAHELRGQGGTFGYPLITVFAKSLYDITKAPCNQDDNSLEIVKAHIDAMRAVMREKIEGDGGEVGQTLFKILKQAINKYAPKQPEPAATA
ncbi:MAG: response regulator [Rhodospirillaceae bacterium]|nr:response regulator [Rhodospirillaceae bacterium]